jgi:hypothetical protein
MKNHRSDRPQRTNPRRLAVACCAGGLALGLGSAAVAAAASELGRVPRKVVAVLNEGGKRKQYVPARHARPRVSKNAAVQDALSSAQDRGCATGISLMRTANYNRPAGRLVWLVSIHTNKRVSTSVHGHGAPPTPDHAANFYIVAVSAKNGRYENGQAGYSRTLPRWKAAEPPGCEDG